MTTSADLIAAAILTAERSQKWVADKSGIPATTLRRKMRGGADFTVGEVARIARTLDVHPADLLPEAFDREVAA